MHEEMVRQQTVLFVSHENPFIAYQPEHGRQIKHAIDFVTGVFDAQLNVEFEALGVRGMTIVPEYSSYPLLSKTAPTSFELLDAVRKFRAAVSLHEILALDAEVEASESPSEQVVEKRNTEKEATGLTAVAALQQKRRALMKSLETQLRETRVLLELYQQEIDAQSALAARDEGVIGSGPPSENDRDAQIKELEETLLQGARRLEIVLAESEEPSGGSVGSQTVDAPPTVPQGLDLPVQVVFVRDRSENGTDVELTPKRSTIRVGGESKESEVLLLRMGHNSVGAGVEALLNWARFKKATP